VSSDAVMVAGLAITPVKGTRLRPVSRVSLGPSGVRENRRFYWIDERDRMVNAKTVGELQPVVADYSDADRRLSLTLADGTVVEGEVRVGEPVTTRFFSRVREDRLVVGPWSEAVSASVGRRLRLVEAGHSGAVDRGAGGAVSLISRASLARLASEAGADSMDVRRFRMLIEVDGVPAHAEDQWVGRVARIGGAEVEFGGHVGRCLVTSRDPDSGTVDLPTLDVLQGYRKGIPATEPLPFGIYGRVVSPGTVAVGDAVCLNGGG
jgi:uncharacterized protein YcbX